MNYTQIYSKDSSQICNMNCNTSVDKLKPASHICSTISRASPTCIEKWKATKLIKMQFAELSCCIWITQSIAFQAVSSLERTEMSSVKTSTLPISTNIPWIFKLSSTKPCNQCYFKYFPCERGFCLFQSIEPVYSWSFRTQFGLLNQCTVFSTSKTLEPVWYSPHHRWNLAVLLS